MPSPGMEKDSRALCGQTMEQPFDRPGPGDLRAPWHADRAGQGEEGTGRVACVRVFP